MEIKTGRTSKELTCNKKEGAEGKERSEKKGKNKQMKKTREGKAMALK